MIICKACRDRRCHTELEKRKFHPLMGQGFTPETGWTHPEAERLHNQEWLQAALVTTTMQAREAFRPSPEAKKGVRLAEILQPMFERGTPS